MTLKIKMPDSCLGQEELDGLRKDFASFGYLLPSSDEELKAFDEIHGTTDIELPEELKDCGFLYERKAPATKPNVAKPGKNSQINSRAKGIEYFRKVVLAAEIVAELHQEPTFGRIKFVKLLYLCEEVCGMELNTSYRKFAAGPLDPKLLYSIEAEFKRQKWFTVSKRDKFGVKYEPMECMDNYKRYFTNYYGQIELSIGELIGLFRNKRSDFCEIVATLFYVWKDCKGKNALVTDKRLQEEFYSWDEKKKRFSVDALNSALAWMRENGVVPN